MNVRAKFKVDSVSEPDGNGLQTVQLRPVYDSNPESENGKFWKWTPAGQISLGTINKSAADAFKVGGEYYVDFSPAQA